MSEYEVSKSFDFTFKFFNLQLIQSEMSDVELEDNGGGTAAALVVPNETSNQSETFPNQFYIFQSELPPRSELNIGDDLFSKYKLDKYYEYLSKKSNRSGLSNYVFHLNCKYDQSYMHQDSKISSAIENTKFISKELSCLNRDEKANFNFIPQQLEDADKDLNYLTFGLEKFNKDYSLTF
ncbi:MAG: hypothetical protein MHMPM18_001666 [Marteilia pararefringens]